MILDLKPARCTRYGRETRDVQTGRATPGEGRTFTFMGSFQPLTGSERHALPEGVRTSIELKVYTKTELRTADQFEKTPADRVHFRGICYTVFRVEYLGLIPHYKAYLVREKE